MLGAASGLKWTASRPPVGSWAVEETHRRGHVLADVTSVVALGEVLLLAQSDEADAVLRRALDLHEQKGNLVGAAHVRQLLGPPAT